MAALTPPQKWVIGTAIGTVALVVGYAVFHRRPRHEIFLPTERLRGEHALSNKHRDDSHERGEYRHEKKHHRKHAHD